MSWNDCLYQYHKKYGGQFLSGDSDDGLLVLSWKERPLVVDLNQVSGRYGSANYVRARLPVTLGKRYVLTIGPENTWSGGVNTVLKAVPLRTDGPVLPADFGFPEVTKKRLIRSENHTFTKLVLGSLELRNALLACPHERVEVRPGPGEEGLHLISVTDSVSLDNGSSDWYIWEYYSSRASAEEKAQIFTRVESDFFPRLDRFLDLAKAAYNAVTQWPM